MAFPRISHDPAVMGGKPCIRRLAILKAYPQLEAADIDEALAYAAWRMEEREVALVLS
jgi:uncharacterized protein (DUF433 family)